MPPKTKRQTQQKLVEVKITIGRDIEGRRIQKSFYAAGKREARAKAEAYLEAQKKGSLVDEVTDFTSWAKLWLIQYKKGKIKDTTYQYTFLNAVNNHLIPYFGKMHLTDIKPIDIQRFFNEKSKSHSKESIKKMRMCLDGIFRTAIENDLCVKNPVTRDTRIPDDDAEDFNAKRTYTREQRDLILEFAKTHRFGLDITVLLKTGIRRGELLGLRWEDVDYKNGVIFIRRAAADVKNEDTGEWTVIIDKPKTPQSIRPIPVDNELLEMIKQKPRKIIVGRNIHKKLDGEEVETEFIFHDRYGKASSPNNWMHRHYKVFMADLKNAYPDMPILNPHELRHTVATLWKDDGVDVYSISKLGGWADLDMIAKRYAHNNIDALKKALKMPEREGS